MSLISNTWSVPSFAKELGQTQLPTSMDVIRHSYYIIDKLQTENPLFARKFPTFTDYKNKVIDDLYQIWNKANVPLINRKSTETKLKKLNEDFRKRLDKAKKKKETSIEDEVYKKLFDLCRCRCDLGSNPVFRYGKVFCNCNVMDRIPVKGKFLTSLTNSLSI